LQREAAARSEILPGRTPDDIVDIGAGLFAIGDVRSGSTKRVAAAVGEGAAVVAQIHAFLASQGVRPDGT